MYLSSFFEKSTVSFAYCNRMGLPYLVDEQAGFCHATSLVISSTGRKSTSKVTKMVSSLRAAGFDSRSRLTFFALFYSEKSKNDLPNVPTRRNSLSENYQVCTSRSNKKIYAS